MRQNERGLSPKDKLMVAHLYFNRNIAQSTLSEIYQCNAGRIAEACNAARDAFKITDRERREI